MGCPGGELFEERGVGAGAPLGSIVKKFLAFLALFGLALLALRFFEGRSGRSREPGEDEGGAPSDQGVETEPTPLEPPRSGEGDSVADAPGEPSGSEGEGDAQPELERIPGLSINGPFEGRLFEGDPGQAIRALVLYIQSEDSRTDAIAIGGPEGQETLRDVLLDATAELFRVGDSDSAQAELSARTFAFDRRATVSEGGGGPDIETNWVRKAELTDVSAHLFSGAPFVPLSFRSASATLDARDSQARTLFAPGSITIDSEELQAQGQDLTVSLDRDSFHFTRSAEVRFERSQGKEVTLASKGRMLVRRLADLDPNAPGQVQIEAQAGARLVLEAEGASVLTAQTIRARGREEAGGFRLTRLDAEGDVVWISDRSEARGERARLDFDSGGQLASWSLEDDPSLRFPLEQLQGLAGEDVPSKGFVRITGEGPLTGRSGDVRGFRMNGPALIEVTDGDETALPSTSLRALGSVWGDIDGDRSRLNAAGGVLLEAVEGQLEAQALTLTLEQDGDGVDQVVVNTIGGAKLVSSTGADSTLTLVSTGRLRATRRGEAWNVNEAEGVTIAVEPKDLETHPEKESEVFRAQAGRVTSFDPISGDLQAEGGVQVVGAQGVGRGQSIRITGSERVELWGTPEHLASFEGPEGSAKAEHIVRERGRTEAQGQVETRFVRIGGTRFAAQDYEVRCDELVAEQGREVDADGSELRTFDLEATGSVDGRVGFGEESSRISCDHLVGKRRERWTPDDTGEVTPFDVTTVLKASGHTTSKLALRDSQVELTSNSFDLMRSESLRPAIDRAEDVAPDPQEEEAVDQRVESTDDGFSLLAEARGEVVFDLFTVRAGSPIHLEGRGHSLTIDETLSGSLTPLPGQQVHLESSLPGQDTPYELDAERVEFRGGETLEAFLPIITVGEEKAEQTSISRFVARAKYLTATEQTVRFEDQVTLQTWTAAGVPWSLEAGRSIEIKGGVGGRGTGPQLDNLRADGDVAITLGLRGKSGTQDVVASAKASRITASSITGTIRLEGFDDGTQASVITPAMITHADWIEVDPEIQLIRRSGPGTMLPAQESNPGIPDWELTYSAAYSYEDHETDSFVFAIDQPYFDSRYMDGILRGTVAMFWFDKVGWQDLPERVRDSDAPNANLRREPTLAEDPPSGVPIARLLELLKGRNLDGVLKEAYFEGPIEILRDDALVAHAEAIYADCQDGNAWLKRAQFNLYGKEVGEKIEKLVVRAEWVRQSSDGVLQANDATITTSPFAEPSVVVETGDLRIVPNEARKKQAYQVYLRENRIRFGREGGFSLPLPPIAFGTDEEYKPLWPTARFANSARFGTLLTLGFRRPLPKALSEPFHDALGGKKEDPYDASFSVDASWLSGRGGLLDLGLDIEAKEKYELETLLGVVPDNSSDQGYIQVPKSDRDNPRLWFRAHSRFELDPGEWIDVEASLQSDAGIQAEFWENDFERYERDESYIQWRRAAGESYYQATGKKRLEVFRSTIEELPSAGAFFGRRPIFALGDNQLIWDGSVNASYLRRRAGEAGFQSPFADTPPLDTVEDEFADGFGDRNVLRFDTRQRLEVPLDLGSTGLVATPFVESRFTAWDKGQNTEATPTRFGTSVGLRLATQFWRRNSNGSLHQLAPFIEYAYSAAETAVGNPVAFDNVDAPRGGDHLDLGLRGRFAVQEGTSLLDLELRARNLRNVPDGLEAGWQPLAVFARMDFVPLGLPVQFWHDGRYDLSDGSTRYALTALGYRATQKLGLELGHRSGLNPLDERLFEAAVLSGQYRWTEKWEFEASQVFSLIRGNGLDTKLTLRRFGTDLVFELEFSVREGEGTSFGISFRPRFGFRPSRIGVINY